VGRALAKALEPLPFAVSLADVRPELAGAADILSTDDMARRARHAPAPACVLVMTHDHALDYRLVAAALQGQARFVGLIGSATKRARFRSRLLKDGVDEAALGRIVCPIGLPGIPGKEPAVIAASVAAQLLGLR
jgi:xanthine dehydrogenase accessory factor